MITQSVRLDHIDMGNGRRALSRPGVKELAASIQDLGLLCPVSVYPVGEAYELVAGRHRVEAVKLLGWPEITAVILDLDDVKREMAEIDENLVRSNLTALDQARQIARRKDLYLKLHPETAPVTQRGGPGRGNKTTADSAVVSYTADTAAKTGVSERTIREDVQIGESIAPDVAEAIRDTPIEDSKTDLLAIARLPEAAQRAVVAEADLTDKASVRQAIGAHRAAPQPEPEPDVDPPIHTTEVQTTVDAFALAALSLFSPDECRHLITLIREGLR